MTGAAELGDGVDEARLEQGVCGRGREAMPASDQLHFAWGGPLEECHPNYWRLHGPITLVEYDNTQNNANHIHSVWHDLTNNWGRDLLREHYVHGHAHG
jgi:Protein of unknown function (DUF3500)